LFFRIKSFFFACISSTSLWYWAKAPELGLEQSGMLLRLVKLLLQGLGAEHCVTVPLQKIKLLAGPLNDILHRATK
jgi:hypothetical protein